MTEAYWQKYESAIDQQIRRATERGDFDDLPGKGKPLPGLDGPDDENWWIKGYVRREGLSTDALLPTSLQLRKELDHLPTGVRDLPSERAVRDVAVELNRRVAEWLRAPSGPRVRIGPVNVDEVVRQWRESRSTAAPAAAGPPDVAPRRKRWWRR
jgi:hypothetical protein